MRTPQLHYGVSRDGKRVRSFGSVDTSAVRQPAAKVQHPTKPLTPIQKLHAAFSSTTALPASTRTPTLAKIDQPGLIKHAVLAKVDAAVQQAVAPLAEEIAALAMRIAHLEADQRTPAQIHVLRH